MVRGGVRQEGMVVWTGGGVSGGGDVGTFWVHSGDDEMWSLLEHVSSARFSVRERECWGGVMYSRGPRKWFKQGKVYRF